MDQVVRTLTFLYKSPDPDFQRFPHESGIIEAGQQDDGAIGDQPGDLPGGFDPIEDGHCDVQDGDIGGELLHRLDGGLAVGRIPYDLDPTALQQGLKRLPEHEMIVREHAANALTRS